MKLRIFVAAGFALATVLAPATVAFAAAEQSQSGPKEDGKRDCDHEKKEQTTS